MQKETESELYSLNTTRKMQSLTEEDKRIRGNQSERRPRERTVEIAGD